MWVMGNIIFCLLMCKKDGIAPAILPLLSDSSSSLVITARGGIG
mgnify:CR=1 FL=1